MRTKQSSTQCRIARVMKEWGNFQEEKVLDGITDLLQHRIIDSFELEGINCPAMNRDIYS